MTNTPNNYFAVVKQPALGRYVVYGAQHLATEYANTLRGLLTLPCTPRTYELSWSEPDSREFTTHGGMLCLTSEAAL